MTTLVNITLIQEGDQISVRSDAIGQDTEVLSLAMRIVSYLSMVEHENPANMHVEMPTLSLESH